MTANLASSSKSQNTRTSSALFTAALQFALFCIRSETELADFQMGLCLEKDAQK